MTWQNIYIKMESKHFRFHTDVLWAIFTLLNIFIFVGGFAQTGGNLYERNKNYGEEYIMQQQSQIFSPTHTPNGSLESPAVGNARQIVYTPINQGSPNTSQNIINQQNRNAAQIMGYKPPPTQADIKEEIKNRMNGKQPELTEQQKQSKEIVTLLKEAYSEEKNRRFDKNYFKTPEFSAKTKSYTDALQYLKGMLSGKNKLSVANAYFAMENAYGNSYLTKKEYDNILNESTDFMKKWIIQNGFNPNDNEVKNMAIQKFLNDTLTITIASPDNALPPQKVTHYPFFYDYEDFEGEKDYRNYFITKCLATGSGQCNSLPAAYNSYAEKLGAKSYLTFAPLHSFNKYPDNKGNMKSYEPTSGWHITDKWYSDNMFISPKAKASGIYLDTLNRKQMVANCVVDLAVGYLKKYGAADGEFVKECLTIATPNFPKKNNIYVYFVYSSLLAKQLGGKLYENKITDLKNINKYPEMMQLYNALQKNEETIKELGYQDTPKELYDEMMQQQEFKGRKQQEKNLSGKEKRNLFIKSH